MFRLLTAGESHGKSLVGVIEGFPANVKIDIEEINRDLGRRQRGYGRGGRMKIEKDRVEILSGVRGGKTLGSPISFLIENKDYANWEPYMNPEAVDGEEKRVTQPRPGHGDLTGTLKYGFDDIRNVLERSSARETAVRVAIGSLAKQLMREFHIEVYSHVTAIGSVSLGEPVENIEKIKRAEDSEVRCLDPEVEKAMIEEIKRAKEEGDSLGGIFEIHVTGVPRGLGSYVQWDHKLDAKLAHALMSIQAIKGVEVGCGFDQAQKKGSQVHDEIFFSQEKDYYRKTNYAGGIEGGMSNGENIHLRCAMKPIPTLYKPLRTVDIETKEAVLATVERSDSCAVPAASIVGEMVAITVIAQEFLKKFGSDSLEEIRKTWKSYTSI
ncbi:Chorismate synthase [Alkaliphilus metalliredigens QYMF]|uniref:Chorismate synthase n=1 Tax=Alkaliphilus metalliredigens (strain QYMF) TaxID=293826 RepID=AROC_ALKMQ|nr:chorismate synthase [Alkaliphilus metalliredigens]A6TL06.1 RecName: Full=Chorismate synthase; Short=CS; AltName: Full=5-enolpyruvylshikimate-3-phosphate phospholyase [Alkaliphilus metalliredigens QYMF]ABR46874.1 Chorismate synthase [Alkaliphilus metalliredigens QYMF]